MTVYGIERYARDELGRQLAQMQRAHEALLATTMDPEEAAAREAVFKLWRQSAYHAMRICDSILGEESPAAPARRASESPSPK